MGGHSRRDLHRNQGPDSRYFGHSGHGAKNRASKTRVENQLRRREISAVLFQAEWLAGVDGEMQIFFVSSDEPSLMELPGMRCRFPHGLPSGGVSRKVAAPRTRYRTVGRLARNVEWLVFGDVIFPNWMLVAAEVLNRKYNPAT